MDIDYKLRLSIKLIHYATDRRYITDNFHQLLIDVLLQMTAQHRVDKEDVNKVKICFKW